jgi:hypothetical protein
MLACDPLNCCCPLAHLKAPVAVDKVCYRSVSCLVRNVPMEGATNNACAKSSGIVIDWVVFLDILQCKLSFGLVSPMQCIC